MIPHPHVDWFALSPSLALIGAAGLLLMVAVFVPRSGRKVVAAGTGFLAFVGAGALAGMLAAKSPHATRSCTTRCGATGGAPWRRC